MGEVLYNLNVTNKRGLLSVGCYIVPLRDVLYQWNKGIFQLDATNDYLCWGFPVHVAMHFIKVYIIEFAYIFMKWSLNLYRQNSCEESNSETKIKIRENDVKLKPLRDIIAYCVLPPKGQTGQTCQCMCISILLKRLTTLLTMHFYGLFFIFIFSDEKEGMLNQLILNAVNSLWCRNRLLSILQQWNWDGKYTCFWILVIILLFSNSNIEGAMYHLYFYTFFYECMWI